MHKTQGENNSANLFTDGPPGTRVEENWLNAVQTELVTVIVTGAGLTLKTAATETSDQLLAAIRAINGTDFLVEHNAGGTHSTINADRIITTGAAGTSTTIGSRVLNDGTSRWRTFANGSHLFGNGTDPHDVGFSRFGVKSFRIDDTVVGNLTEIQLLTDLLTISKTSDGIVHTTTTKTMTFGSHHARPSSVLPAVVDDNAKYVRPTTADDALDEAYIGVNLPVGATVTRFDIYGLAAAGADNVVSAALSRRLITGVTVTPVANASFNNGGTTAADTGIDNSVIAEGYEYKIKIQVSADNAGAVTDSKFYGTKITYTVRNIAQTI